MTTYDPDHNGECLNCDEPLDAHICSRTLVQELQAWTEREGQRVLKELQDSLPEWDPDNEDSDESVYGLASRLLDMVERVEWVRQQGGKASACPFCHGVSERDGGPGHTEDCEWVRVCHAGNDLRLKGVLR